MSGRTRVVEIEDDRGNVITVEADHGRVVIVTRCWRHSTATFHTVGQCAALIAAITDAAKVVAGDRS